MSSPIFCTPTFPEHIKIRDCRQFIHANYHDRKARGEVPSTLFSLAFAKEILPPAGVAAEFTLHLHPEVLEAAAAATAADHANNFIAIITTFDDLQFEAEETTPYTVPYNLRLVDCPKSNFGGRYHFTFLHGADIIKVPRFFVNVLAEPLSLHSTNQLHFMASIGKKIFEYQLAYVGKEIAQFVSRPS